MKSSIDTTIINFHNYIINKLASFIFIYLRSKSSNTNSYLSFVNG
jgi:hypothetical protein